MVDLFQRDLNKCGVNITLQNRDIAAPVFGTSNFDETFSGDQVVKAIITTERGKVLFDGVGTDNPITHVLYIAYIAGVTSETWVLLSDGTRLDIVDVENKNEQNKCLILRCNERGTGEAAKA